MDVFAHGLWSVAVAKGASNRTQKPLSLKLALAFGVAPDLASFGILFVQRLLEAGTFRPGFLKDGHPDPALVPAYVHSLYNITHSLVTFSVVFLIVWALRRKPLWEMLAWLLHILCDLPTHSTRFFPTPWLWPFPHPFLDGWPWARWGFQIPNYLLLGLTLWLAFRRPGPGSRAPRTPPPSPAPGPGLPSSTGPRTAGSPGGS